MNRVKGVNGVNRVRVNRVMGVNGVKNVNRVRVKNVIGVNSVNFVRVFSVKFVKRVNGGNRSPQRSAVHGSSDVASRWRSTCPTCPSS